MNTSTRAVFLSYASQDAEAARRICDALRAVGLDVWFDQSALRGGDAWDASIRRQIKECALFVPIISANTQAREEGYFRREWNLAVNRTLDMADDRAFLLPVVIDATIDVNARVPEKFRNVQWTHLPAGEAPAAFAERVQRLMSGAPRRRRRLRHHAWCRRQCRLLPNPPTKRRRSGRSPIFRFQHRPADPPRPLRRPPHRRGRPPTGAPR
jgi:hypothetical protein